ASISCNLFRMLSSPMLSLLLHHLFRLQSGFYRQELLVFLEFTGTAGIVIFQGRHFLVNYFELTEYALLLLQALEGDFFQFFITQLVHIDSLPSFFGTGVPYCMNINIELKFPVNPEFYAFFRLKMPDDLEIRCNDHADGHTAEEHAVPYPEFRIVLECFELEDPLAFGHRFLIPLLYVLRLLVVSAHEPGIQADDGDAAAVFTHFAVMDPERLVAHLLDLADGVADEEDRPALLAELLHAPDAFVGECIITDGECLVDDEHIRIGVDGDGEAEAGLHAARIILDRPVHEILELAEFDDIPILLVDLPLAHAVHQALHADVLFPRQLHVEPGGNR